MTDWLLDGVLGLLLLGLAGGEVGARGGDLCAALRLALVGVGQRGAGGGFSLARPAETITLGQVVRALEGGSALVECFRDDGGDCVLLPRCRLKARLAAAREAFMRELDGTTLAECAYLPRPARAS